MKRFASGMSWSMVSFRAAMPTREIADRRTITENPRPPIHRMGGGDMREADDELEDVGHARGNPRPADELVDVLPARTPTNPACRRHRRGCPRGPRGRRSLHQAREAGRRWRRAEATV